MRWANWKCLNFFLNSLYFLFYIFILQFSVFILRLFMYTYLVLTYDMAHAHYHAHVYSIISDGMQEEEKGLLLRGPDPPQSNFSPIFTGETLNPVCESGLTLQAIPTSALCQNWFQIAEQCCACVLALLVYLVVSPWEMINFSSFRIWMVIGLPT